ncbi:MAG: DUF2344 domain-containing protein [Christensenellaceae bacterium]|nr:DUF2344 domain-containing protein [Christensenellaceae bacterium]
MRTVIKYSRKGDTRYISHLDMQRAFARALRRSGLPVAYSEGYNPHIVMSFASPLSVGFATEGDYLEVKMAEDVEPGYIKDRLAAVMPEGISIITAGILPDTCKKLMSLNAQADYRIDFSRDITGKAEELFGQESITVEDRKGRDKDIRPLIIDYKAEGQSLYVTLSNSSEKTLNPALIVRALGEDPGSVLITRLECYAGQGDSVVPLSDLAE